MSTPTDSFDGDRCGRNAKDRADDIVVECDLPDPPEKVWRALTVPELLALWLMPSSDIQPRAGARFRFQGQEPVRAPVDGVAVASPRPSDTGQEPRARRMPDCVDCEVLEVEPHRLLRYRWSEHEGHGRYERRLDSVVSFELTPTPAGGTHLRVVHTDFRVATVIRLAAQESSTARLNTRKGPVALGGCQALAASRIGRPPRGWGAAVRTWSLPCAA